MNQRLPSAQKLMLPLVMVIEKMNNREHRSVISLDRSALFNKCFSFYPIWFVTYSAHILQNTIVTEGVETIGANSPTSGSVENELLDEVIFLTILQNIRYFCFTFSTPLVENFYVQEVVRKDGQNLITPTVGQTFESEEQAYEMYNTYAGLPVRLDSVLERARQSTAEMVVYVRNL
jgi:hypothetical protein